MDGKRNYMRCNNISGKGLFGDKKFETEGKFKVLNLSGSGVLILTERKLEINDIVEMRIVFAGYINEKEIKVKGRVVREESGGDAFRYGMEFVGIPHKERVEIDEIMNLSCSREPHKGLNNCDHGECIVLK